METEFPKEFNIEGACYPEAHYMVDISQKLDAITRLIDKGKYFTINRARQFGKTTTLDEIYRRLSDRYLVLQISFERISTERFSKEDSLCESIVSQIESALEDAKNKQLVHDLWFSINTATNDLESLMNKVSLFCEQMPVPVILLIDEVDKSSNNQMFLDFLGVLRNKYLDRNRKGMNSTLHSVILAGVHDVKNLKLKIRPEAEHKYNSPWNIAAEFEVDMSFNPLEISTMLEDYENDHKTGMDIKVISEEIYKYTSGYPFLVSKICKVIDEKLDKTWTVQGVQDAIKRVSEESNSLFESLTKNIDNNKDLYNFIYDITLLDKSISYVFSNNLIRFAEMYSIIKKTADNRVAIHNLIFETVIYNHFVSEENIANDDRGFPSRANYVINNRLQMESLIHRFHEFMYEEHRDSDEPFIEREGRLLFLCFLKPVINGNGFYYVEPETRNSSRMDLIVTYGGEEFIVELKIWRGQKYETEGKKQLAEYLKTRGLDAGYLVTFDFSKNKKQTEPAWVECEGKRIYEAII